MNIIRAYFITLFFFLLVTSANAQPKVNHRKYDCGFYVKNFNVLEHDYFTYLEPLDCKKRETIASIGAGNGQFEAEISAFNDSITWYLEDIDSLCLNLKNFDRIRKYFGKLKGNRINGTFHLVIGDEKSPHLPENFFDRVVMVNVYHELDEKRDMMHNIQHLLKPGGELVISEVMARNPGDLHTDCGKPKLWEHDFLAEMRVFGYKLVEEKMVEPQSRLKMFFFRNAATN